MAQDGRYKLAVKFGKKIHLLGSTTEECAGSVAIDWDKKGFAAFVADTSSIIYLSLPSLLTL